MGRLLSCVKKIAEVRFEPFPSNRVVSGITKTVRVGGYATYTLSDKGIVYTTGEMGRNVCYAGTGKNYHAVTALRLFGIITKDEAKLHGKDKEIQDKLFAEYRAVTCEIERLTSAGIKLTSAQKRRLTKMKKSLDVKRLPYFVQGEAARKLGIKPE